MDVLLDGTVPKSAGLSSSSALVCCGALATAHANNKTFSKVNILPTFGTCLKNCVSCDCSRNSLVRLFSCLLQLELAEICQKSERYIGTEGGGMDQAISFLAETGKVRFMLHC